MTGRRVIRGWRGLVDTRRRYEADEHHAASFALLAGTTPARFAVSAHSYAEAYSTLTRSGERALFGYRMSF